MSARKAGLWLELNENLYHWTNRVGISASHFLLIPKNVKCHEVISYSRFGHLFWLQALRSGYDYLIIHFACKNKNRTVLSTANEPCPGGLNLRNVPLNLICCFLMMVQFLDAVHVTQ